MLLNIYRNSQCKVTDLKNTGVCKNRKNQIALELYKLSSSNKNT